MPEQYTPTGDDVREVWGAWSIYGGLVTRPNGDPGWDGRYAEFDAWLARVRRDAFREGQTVGVEDALLACEIASGIKPGPPPGPTPNPYEETP